MSATIRKASARGHANHGWLDSHHTFSFGNYHDPAQMGFGPLRVINEDRVAPGAGFDTHGHRDMEILSYVIEGALEHKDSIGTGSVIRPGDLQVMSAGSGIRHSEFNHSKIDPVHFLQVWIVPEKTGLPPGYQQQNFPTDAGLRLIGSPDGRDGSLVIHANVGVYAGVLGAKEVVTQPIAAGRRAWVQIVRGELRVNGQAVAAGDGVAVEGESELVVRSEAAGAEVIVFDLP